MLSLCDSTPVWTQVPKGKASNLVPLLETKLQAARLEEEQITIQDGGMAHGPWQSWLKGDWLLGIYFPVVVATRKV